MSKENKPFGKIIRLSGIGIQMGIIIFLGAYLGRWLDEKYSSETKWFTLIFTILAVAVALYFVLKQVNRINNENDAD